MTEVSDSRPVKMKFVCSFDMQETDNPVMRRRTSKERRSTLLLRASIKTDAIVRISFWWLYFGWLYLAFWLDMRINYQLDVTEYLFVYFQLDMFRAYTPIFRSNRCYNFFTYAAYGVLSVAWCWSCGVCVLVAC